MNNKFALSFGISLVIVGFLNIFFETSNIVLFGLSVSTAIFSIINIFVINRKSSKSELLYIIPFVLLVSIFCYSDSLMKYDVIEKIVNGKFTNVLTFVSFGFLFISEFFNYKKEKKDYITFQMDTIIETMRYSALILNLQNEYLRSLVDNKNKIDSESKKFFDEIEKLCDEKIKQAELNYSLLNLNKELFSVRDFNKIYQSLTDNLNIDDKPKKYNKKHNKK